MQDFVHQPYFGEPDRDLGSTVLEGLHSGLGFGIPACPEKLRACRQYVLRAETYEACNAK